LKKRPQWKLIIEHWRTDMGPGIQPQGTAKKMDPGP
jgi:hypothetical protein